jgi:hypothetical protein
MEGILNAPMGADAGAKHLRVSREAGDIIPIFNGDFFADRADGFNHAYGFDGVPGRMGGNQPGNIVSYGMAPPFLSPVINIEGAVGLNEGVRTGEINAVKGGFNVVIKSFLVLFERKHVIGPRFDYLVGYFILAAHGVS